MKKIKLNDLQVFCTNALVKSGMTAENAKTVSDVLTMTDTFGVVTHVTKNLNQYIQKMAAGGLDVSAQPSVEKEGPSWAIINGNKAIGMVSACKAMSLAVEKAKETGIAYVGVKNSCHFGAAGYYSNMAAKEGVLDLTDEMADSLLQLGKSTGIELKLL